jgi:hypothetical protein
MLKTKRLSIFSAGLIRLYHLWDKLVFASPLEDYYQALQEHNRMGQDYLQALQKLSSDRA